MANDTTLEAEFRKVAADIGAQISAKLKAAADAIAEATKLAEEHGLPFDAEVSPLAQAYVPKSFDAKWAALAVDGDQSEDGLVYDLTGVSRYTIVGAGGFAR